MSFARNADWGHAEPLPHGAAVVTTDAELRAIVTAARRADRALPTVGLLGGDLCRTLGGRGDADRLRSPEAWTVPVDVGSVLVDGRHHWFVAHLVARRSWWRGRVVAVMNAQWLGAWDLAPRSHPGDGLLDVSDGDLPLGERFKARRRLRTGTHVPHPGIGERRVGAVQLDLDPPLDVWLDGESVGRASALSIRVEPAALSVVV